MADNPPRHLKFRGSTYRLAAGQPFFSHDCNNCKYLGSAVLPNGENGDKLDFYVHEKEDGRGSAIVRYSNDPSDNQSMPLDSIQRINKHDPLEDFVLWETFYRVSKG